MMSSNDTAGTPEWITDMAATAATLSGCSRLVCQTIAAHVDGAGGEAGGGDGIDLVAPAVPALRKAVDHQDQRAGALHDRADLGAAGVDGAELLHAGFPIMEPRHASAPPLSTHLTAPARSAQEICNAL